MELCYEEFKKKMEKAIEQKKKERNDKKWNRNDNVNYKSKNSNSKWKRNEKPWKINFESNSNSKKRENKVILDAKLKRKMLSDRPSSSFNARIIEFWPKNTMPIFKRNGDFFCVEVDGKWWVFQIDFKSDVSGGILSCKSGTCIKDDFLSYKVIKDCVIYVVNDRLDDFHFRIRICPSLKHDKLAIFNIDKSMRLREEAMFAAIQDMVVSDDIHWTLSLLNHKNGPQEETGTIIYSLPKCGWYIKRKC